MCFVYKAMGESLAYFQNRLPNKRFAPSPMRKLIRQLFQALDLVHSSGIAHAGRSNWFLAQLAANAW